MDFILVYYCTLEKLLKKWIPKDYSQPWALKMIQTLEPIEFFRFPGNCCFITSRKHTSTASSGVMRHCRAENGPSSTQSNTFSFLTWLGTPLHQKFSFVMSLIYLFIFILFFSLSHFSVPLYPSSQPPGCELESVQYQDAGHTVP